MRVALVLAALMMAGCTASEVVETTAVATTDATGNTTTTTPSPSTTSTSVPLDADVILHDGVILTMDPASTIATGLAILDGRIVAVGEAEELLSRAPEAAALDLEGRTVIPGIVDPHIHLEQNQSPDYDLMIAEEQMLLESGRTTLGVPAIIPFNLAGYEGIAARGGPLLRSHFYLAVNTSCNDPVESEGWWKEYEFDRSAELRFAYAGIKLFTDGGGCNDPAFTFDWVDGTQGDLYVDAEYVADILRQADEVGALAVVHAVGDRGVDVALTGFEEALAGDNPNRHRIDHNTIVHEDWVSRYGESGANFVGWAWFNSCLEQSGAGWESLGTEHLPWLRTHKTVMEANPDITVAWHSDAPWTPTSIFEQWLSLTTFISLDENDEPCPAPEWLSGKEVDIETAIRMMTIEAAAVMDLDTDLGSLEVGKIADLAILERNPLDLEGLALLENRVVSTWTTGRPAWCGEWLACSELQSEGVAETSNGMSVSASSSRDTHVPALVLDGSVAGESFWSSGADPPGWIQVDFDTPATVENIRFTVFQNPEGDTVHVLELLVDGVWVEAQRFQGFTATGDVLEWAPDEPAEGVEAFRMTTTESPSWPERSVTTS